MNTIKELLYFDEYPDEIIKHNGGATNTTQNDNKKKDLKYIDNKGLSTEMFNFFNEIIEIAKDNFNRVYNIFIGWVLTPIIFGSFAPALPFFLVMGVLYAIFNYLQKIIEKL